MTIRKASLTPQRKKLLELMSNLNFGSIEMLSVAGGEPVFDPPPRIIRDVKLDIDGGPRPDAERDDFALKSQQIALLKQLDRVGNGTIRLVLIRHGLPFRFQLEEPAPS